MRVNSNEVLEFGDKERGVRLGHGISIGGLGAGGSKACISDVIIGGYAADGNFDRRLH